MNCIVSTVIGKLVSEDVAKWTTVLQEAVFAINTTVSTATGRTPYEAVYGRKCLTWVDRKLDQVGRGAEIAHKC